MIAYLLQNYSPTGADAPLLAVADLHGDLNQTLAALRLADAVDGNGRWAGGRATLVQTGDVLDRGPDSLAIVALLERLRVRTLRKNKTREKHMTFKCGI